MNRPVSNGFEPCPNCDGDGRLTAQRSGDWRQQPERYRPDQMVDCIICGATGQIPKRGTFSEG
ncbi:hypothetical protein [Magnetospira sp. QH-2]|uniref:hypothetical protein n=1 Tax=Magnetospira sp. (strain QH-2) TaxID=1288970 RepID=UPI0005F9ED71|nr:hypothetical protein [Magnetospira sp. QH-2]